MSSQPERAALPDSQESVTDPVRDLPIADRDEFVAGPVEPAASARAQDEQRSAEERFLALRQWLSEEPGTVRRFVIRALDRPQPDREFRDALVYLAEDLSFDSAADRKLLARVLGQLARKLALSGEVDADPVVWSALRRYASLLSPDELGELQNFLTNNGQVDTRLVALNAVVHACEREPLRSASLASLRARVFALAERLLHPDVLTAGETTAILEQAICALAGLGDPRFVTCVVAVQAIGWDWFTSALLKRLAELHDGWSWEPLDASRKDARDRFLVLMVSLLPDGR